MTVSHNVKKFKKSLKINESFDSNSGKAPNTKANQITTGRFEWQPSPKPLPKKMLKNI